MVTEPTGAPLPEPTRPKMGRFRVGCVIGLVAGGLVAAAVLLDRATPIPVTPPDPTPVILPVTTTDYTPTTSVALKTRTSAPLQGIVHRSGILTNLAMSVGTSLHDGDIVARIDGDAVVAMVTPTPLYRDLTSGDTGGDVSVLQTWLRAQGYTDAEPDGEFGPRTIAAMKNWQAALGLEATGTFSLATTIWVGPTPPTVGELLITSGQLTNDGDTLFTTTPTIDAIAVAEPPGGIQQSGDQLLVVGEVSVPYTLGSGEVTDVDAAAQIAQALGASGEGVGRVRPAQATQVTTLPASAVVTDATGLTCVFESVDGPPTRITALSGGFGTVSVGEEFPLTSVLANPTLTRSDLACS